LRKIHTGRSRPGKYQKEDNMAFGKKRGRKSKKETASQPAVAEKSATVPSVKKLKRTPAKAPQPPMKDGAPDLSQATHVEKDPETKKMIYVFANRARVIV
jgi:hypothetical protein